MIYFNNAATSYPRLPQVVEAVKRSLMAPPQEPGRCGFEDPLMACRSAIAKLYGVADPLRVLLTTSATLGCNQILFGLRMQAGSHVITSCMEHNSVLRPLNELVARNECSLSVLPLEDDGSFSIDRVGGALRPETRLMAFVHVSNVTGAIFPVQALAVLAAARNVPLLIDDSQGAGLVPLDLASLPGRVFLVAAGHKALQGPPGTGFFIVPDAVSLSPWITGGTGVHSVEDRQPPMLPYRLEAGTPNSCGFAGLLAGVTHVLETTPAVLAEHRRTLAEHLVEHLPSPWTHIAPGATADYRAGVVSLVHPTLKPSEAGLMLQEIYGIETRWGLHCAPLAHRHLGTFPDGTLRIGLGEGNTIEEVEQLIEALHQSGNLT